MKKSFLVIVISMLFSIYAAGSSESENWLSYGG